MVVLVRQSMTGDISVTIDYDCIVRQTMTGNIFVVIDYDGNMTI